MPDSIDHSWNRHCQQQIDDACRAASAVLTDVKDRGAYIWRTNLDLIDQAIADLQRAKALHLSRLADDRKDAA